MVNTEENKIELWKGTSEEFLIKQGWKKIKGYRVDLEYLDDYNHYNYPYVESTDDFIINCEYWSNENGKRYEDPDEAIEKEFGNYFDEQDNLYSGPVNLIR